VNCKKLPLYLISTESLN